MKKLFFITIALVSLFVVNSCKERKTSNVISVVDTTDVDVPDSTIYGICGDGTTMHNLQLITDAGDTMNVFIDDEEPNIVKGGLLAGDRIALILNGQKNEELGDVAAQQVINLTSLLGKWTSLDKNFKIIEGGEVKNNVKAGHQPPERARTLPDGRAFQMPGHRLQLPEGDQAFLHASERRRQDRYRHGRAGARHRGNRRGKPA